MIKVFYKSMTIEFESLADVIAFVEHFNPPDILKKESEYELNNSHNVGGYSETFYKCHKIYTSLDGNLYHVYGPGIFAVTFKTLGMAKSAIDLWEDSQKKVYEPIKFEKPEDSKIKKPEIPQRIDLQSFDEISLSPKKKRGRPKKVTEHDDKVVAIAGLSEKGVPLSEEEFEDVDGKEFVEGVCEKLAESVIKESKKNKEDLIMGIDDVAKELSRAKAMLFTEEALRKIFQKAYKPALKTDVKATYPLTQLDPQMYNTFVSEVSNKLGMKCILSYKVGKDGFTYILMK